MVDSNHDGDTKSLRRRTRSSASNSKTTEGSRPQHELLLSQTRVCIKNFPPKTTERDLKEFLLRCPVKNDNNNNSSKRNASTFDSTSTSVAETLQITDCKILKNSKGISKNVAFVGFRSAKQAELAIRTFHKSFFNMSRITVEPAVSKKTADHHLVANQKEVKTTNQKMSGSKSASSSLKPSADMNKKSQGSDNVQKEQNDKWNELLQLMGANNNNKSRSNDKPKFWSNDDVMVHEQNNHNALQVDDTDMTTPHHNDNDDDDDDDDDDVDIDFSSSALNNKNDAIDSDDDDHEGDNEPQQEQQDPQQSIATSRLFVRNLPFETTEEELHGLFAQFGSLIECHVPVNDQGKNKGYAFIMYESPVHARQAREQLDKADFQGRSLHILQARPCPSSETRDSSTSLNWKQKQELKRKDQETKIAGKSATGWSASFVRGDAVVDNLAERLGLRKGELLAVKDDLSSGDAAVRLALGETQIIEENRAYFREHGVDMDVLVSANMTEDEKDVKRSKTSILVKNLPADTRIDELTKVFHTGDVNVNVLLPPSRTVALVEFQHPSDAKQAFRKLAYRRFKHVPLYLEWAPLKAKLDPTQEPSKTVPPLGGGDGENHVLSKSNVETDVEESHNEMTSEEDGSALYVKNLNFSTTEETLCKVFEDQLGKVVVSVRIPRKIAPTKKRTNGTEQHPSLSMGYGFVELESPELAKKAMRILQGKLVDGHALVIAISSKQSSQPTKLSKLTAASGNKPPTKIMIRNVPFQATRKELLTLFGSFGQLRKIRLPKKFDGSHRGFAFVEFVTGKEALSAITALSQTHLYGRHLVLEWAANDDEDELSRLRDKAKHETTAAVTASTSRNKKTRLG